MEEPDVFNLLLSLVGGIVILFVFAFGGLLEEFVQSFTLSLNDSTPIY